MFFRPKDPLCTIRMFRRGASSPRCSSNVRALRYMFAYKHCVTSLSSHPALKTGKFGFSLGLTAQEKSDVVEYPKSLPERE